MADVEQGAGGSLVSDKRALLVEDDVDLLAVTTQILQFFGFTVAGFSDGGEALQWFNGNVAAVDLVMVDRRLPSIGGGALFRVMHAVAPRLPIILYSGDISGEEERQLLAEGVSAVLRKPIGIKQFQQAIVEVMDLPSPAPLNDSKPAAQAKPKSQPKTK